VLFAVVAAVTMRLVAEERRQGTWETLVTAPVAEGAVLAGKWLGAWTFLVVLWLPTLAYPIVLAAFAPPGVAIDLGPLASAYLGVALLVAAAAAIGLLASALTQSQVVASIVAFALLLGLLALGELDELLPAATDGALGAVTAALDLRRRLDDFARGAIALSGVVVLLGLALAAGAAAHAAAALGRWRAARGRRRVVVAALIALDVARAVALVRRHDVVWDWSAADVNTLSPATRELVAELARDRPLAITVVRPALAQFEPVFAEVDRLIARIAEAAPGLARRDLDAARDAEALAALADEFGAPPRDLADGGAVVLELGGRRRLVELLDMASFARDALAAGAIERLVVEQSVSSALAELVRGAPLGVCFTAGHGEPPLDDGARVNLDRLRRALEADAVKVARMAVPVPRACRVVVVAAPTTPLSPAEALAIERHLAGGGGLLVLARGPGPTGLELVLAGAGLALTAEVANDPSRAVELPEAFGVTEGYADHPVTRPFQGRRMTVWQAPRVVAPVAGAGGEVTVLVATDGGARPIAAASRVAATGARVALFGGGGALAGVLAEAVPANVDLGRRTIGWLGGREAAVLAPAKTPEHVRLIMSSAELAAVFALCALALPALALVAGGLVAWRRRRG
jgi:ABC-2 type transport system permease protein